MILTGVVYGYDDNHVICHAISHTISQVIDCIYRQPHDHGRQGYETREIFDKPRYSVDWIF